MATSNVSYQIPSLLEKMTSTDKDFRYMATNDLMTELQKDNIILDDDLERKVVKALLNLLNDKNGEVQNLAIRCLSPLVHKIKLAHVDSVITVLCNNMDSSDDRLRDVSSIALKTIMVECPSTMTSQLAGCVKYVVPRLVEGLRSNTKADISVKLEMLEILCTSISRYGRFVTLDFQQIEKILFFQMEKEKQALRKRAVITLGYLVEIINEQQYDLIVNNIRDACIANEGNLTSLRIYLLAVSTVCRSTSSRFSSYLPEFVPLLLKFCKSNEDDELRETCLQAFETFVLRCTREVEPFIPQIASISADLQKYDPNYNYEEDVDMDDDDETAMNIDDADEYDDEEFSDDDDFSWKVRRSATKCIEALITCRGEKLLENFRNLGPLLIDRFKEREENVKIEVFNAYIALLRQTKYLVPACFQRLQSSNIDLAVDPFSNIKFDQSIRDELGSYQLEIFAILKGQVPNLVKALQKPATGKNIRIRQRCFVLLDNLIQAYPGALSNNIRLVIIAVKTALLDKRSDGNMKIETLRFLNSFFSLHEPKDLCASIDTIAPLILVTIDDPFYKIAAEALTVSQALIRAIRPEFCENLDYNTLAESIYKVVFSKLKISDIDQELKEKTIITSGLLVAVFHDYFPQDTLNDCFNLLLDRLRNEMTRLISIKAFQTILSRPSKIDLSKIMPGLLTQLRDFLRKNQRTLRINVLMLLQQLVSRFSQNGLENNSLIKLVQEIPILINEQDLQISQKSLRFITDVVSSYPDQISDTLPTLLDSLIKITQGSLLQGSTLNAALALFSALVKSPLPNKPSFEQLIDRLSCVVYSSEQLLHRQTYISIGKAIAAITLALNDKQKATELVKKLNALLTDKRQRQRDSAQLFAIITLGEVGRIYPLAYESLDKSIKVQDLIMNSFTSPSEEIKIAACYALGSLAVGCLSKYLAFILEEIDRDTKKQYLLLHSLKEVIVSESTISEGETSKQLSETFVQYVPRIWEVLAKHCDCSEEGVRNIVAECLGKLCIVDPDRFLSELLKCVSHESSYVRGTVVTAVRFMITDQPQPIDSYLQPVIGKFLETSRDADLQVRRVAIITLNAAVHNKPKMIRDYLPLLLPSLYEETMVRKELVREVEMGPFKHIVDDGLDLRKAAFECMYTLSEKFLDRLDILEFLSKLENGIQDQHDIKLLTYLMIVRLSYKCPVHVVQYVDKFCDHIRPQLLAKPKQNAVKQENEKQDELKRSAIRVLILLRRISVNHNQSQTKICEVFDIIRQNSEVSEMLDSIEKEPLNKGCFLGTLSCDVMDIDN